MGIEYAPETIIPLQPLTVNPVMLAVELLDELAMTFVRTHEPLPKLDIVLIEPLPVVVL